MKPWCLIAAVGAVVVTSCSAGRSTTGATPTSSSTALQPIEGRLSICRDAQLTVEPKQFNGGTQHIVAAYWISNGSPDDCVVPPGLQIDFLDSAGRVLTSRTRPDGGASLPAHISNPDPSPPAKTVAWFAIVFGRIDIAHGASCPPDQLTVPTSVRVRFGDTPPITLVNASPDGERIEICRADVSLLPVSAIS